MPTEPAVVAPLVPPAVRRLLVVLGAVAAVLLGLLTPPPTATAAGAASATHARHVHRTLAQRAHHAGADQRLAASVGRGSYRASYHRLSQQAVNVSRPTVSGPARVGAALEATSGAWQQHNLHYRYQWSVGGVDVAAATGTRFVVPSWAVGQPVRIAVTADRAQLGSATAVSRPTTPVRPGQLSGRAPRLAGAPRVGHTLSVVGARVAPTPRGVRYQWLRNGHAIARATSAHYRLGSADRGGRVSVRVTCTRPGYTTLVITSSRTGPIRR